MKPTHPTTSLTLCPVSGRRVVDEIYNPNGELLQMFGDRHTSYTVPVLDDEATVFLCEKFDADEEWWAGDVEAWDLRGHLIRLLRESLPVIPNEERNLREAITYTLTEWERVTGEEGEEELRPHRDRHSHDGGNQPPECHLRDKGRGDGA